MEIISTNLDQKEDETYAHQCLTKIENLLQGTDAATNQGFQIIHDKRTLKKIASEEFVKAYPRNANRSGRFASNVPPGK